MILPPLLALQQLLVPQVHAPWNNKKNQFLESKLEKQNRTLLPGTKKTSSKNQSFVQQNHACSLEQKQSKLIQQNNACSLEQQKPLLLRIKALKSRNMHAPWNKNLFFFFSFFFLEWKLAEHKNAWLPGQWSTWKIHSQSLHRQSPLCTQSWTSLLRWNDPTSLVTLSWHSSRASGTPRVWTARAWGTLRGWFDRCQYCHQRQNTAHGSSLHCLSLIPPIRRLPLPWPRALAADRSCRRRTELCSLV